MAASPAFDLQQAVYGALVADGTLTTLLSGPHVYDAVPDNAAVPYVHVGEATVRDRSTGTEDGVSVTFLIAVWSREAGRAEGLSIAERVRELVVDEEISIGDYVLSGGEVAAMVLVEALSRQVPGVVGLADSVVQDSFRDGLLDFPHYTRPRDWEGRAIPEVLLSGDHGRIADWRQAEAERMTRERRPDLWARRKKP